MKLRLLNIIIFCFFGLTSNCQEVTGKWTNFNENGEPNSIIRIYEKNGEIYGEVERILREEDRNRVCTKCEGDLKNKPIEGMTVMWGLEKNGDEYVDGNVVDPKTGKEYRCKIWIDDENPDVLNVRGYVSLFYKTRTWERAE
ncbi:DUF2147 domain-containing protein [Gramella sp. GC03-9]|uniref:DUF2147 domain-containing protein n=1 Tax=Christiangramia oceanisediminis TaxID=2920386 RepID=A0A9X2KXL3_9FLAO|nr:DUF2147 domain-containing protein [Gramella oceanisediminis]MCP9200144.1 DUF2147 domain-containing protein [Gramella oceanisediminis]